MYNALNEKFMFEMMKARADRIAVVRPTERTLKVRASLRRRKHSS